MNGKEIIHLLGQGKTPDRVPFAPTIYEHAAALLHTTPSRMARDEDLIVEGQLAACELYRPDLISVGVDIYNVEAEALGCRIRYFEDNTLPAAEAPLVTSQEDLHNLTVPDPARDGRMPVLTHATARLCRKIGHEVPVSGTITGPFTLAAILRGYESFLMDLIFDTEFALKQLDFSLQVALAYAGAFAGTGAGIAVNESWIAPPLLSPALFREHVFPYEKHLIHALKVMGFKTPSLISGGDTAPIADLLVQTGTSLLMADANTDQKAYKKLCLREGINLRASIESKLVEAGNESEMEAAVQKVMGACAEGGRFIFGCGVLSYNTPSEHVLKLKELVEKHNPYKK